MNPSTFPWTAIVSAASMLESIIGVWVKLNARLEKMEAKQDEAARKSDEQQKALDRLTLRDGMISSLVTKVDVISQQLERVQSRLDRFLEAQYSKSE